VATVKMLFNGHVPLRTKHVRTLQRRLEFLESRSGSEGTKHFDRAEAAALRAVLRELVPASTQKPTRSAGSDVY
jgi:hypothetical protein